MSKSALTLEIKRMKPAIERIVEEKIAELLGDTDVGLDVKTTVKNNLVGSLKTKKEIPAEKIAKKYGVKW
ncbi:MAG: hypothetical protein CVU77_04710 [Elusimicrobia bacterium HGW-Elusimicrobia-1]|jgi:hypothetical protein|nr:MAG: hypothetical protein CVU77_04710 [Elusimicrobia bacterium HGW-Elusimicrobia-1]